MSIIIISPSGNLYGSERVLLDFLTNARNDYDLYIPAKGVFQDELKKNRIDFRAYNNSNLKLFYLIIFIKLLFSRIGKIYVNEGGHVRYIKILSRLLPWKRFFLHIRILEDTTQSRLGKLNSNITLLSISDYMQEELLKNAYRNVIKINDPYPFGNQKNVRNKPGPEVSFSMIGRFTSTKGSEYVIPFFRLLDKSQEGRFRLNIFGNIDSNPEVQGIINELEELENIDLVEHGFIEDQEWMYTQTDILLHFNRNEPLGRIFLEAIDQQLPLLGFKTGGIAEIGHLCGLDHFLVPPTDGWEHEMLLRFYAIMQNWEETLVVLSKAKDLAMEHYSSESYIHKLEDLFYD